MSISKTTLVLIVIGILVLGGLTWSGVKVHAYIAERRMLTELKEENPVEYYVLHTPKKQTDEQLRNEMIGTWKLVGAKSRRTGQFVILIPWGNLYFKSFTESNWAIVTYDSDSNVVYSAGGPFTLSGEFYTETIEKATGSMTQYLGAKPSFRIRVLGDDYYQMGKGKDPSIEEQWHRVTE
jgi:hypothetical protein